MNSLYFVAVNTPEPLSEMVREIQQEFADNYASKRQLRIPVHITIIPPFKSEEKEMERFRSSLRRFAAQKGSFNVHLKNFGSFRERTIYVDVVPSKALDLLYSEVHDWLESDVQFTPPIKHPVFRPHVTVANRDLQHDQFIKAWRIFKDRSFEASFSVDRITLLKHNGHIWEVLDEAPFDQ